METLAAPKVGAGRPSVPDDQRRRPVSHSLRPATIAALDDLCARTGMKKSTVVDAALEAEIARLRALHGIPENH